METQTQGPGSRRPTGWAKAVAWWFVIYASAVIALGIPVLWGSSGPSLQSPRGVLDAWVAVVGAAILVLVWALVVAAIPHFIVGLLYLRAGRARWGLVTLCLLDGLLWCVIVLNVGFDDDPAVGFFAAFLAAAHLVAACLVRSSASTR